MKKECWEGLLPIGSVVTLKDADKSLMIVGRSQTPADDDNKFYDYSGILYPEGYLDRQHLALFNHEDIEEVRYIGYIDFVQRNFTEILEPIHAGLKSGELTLEEVKEMMEEMAADKEG